jgi:small subunit ribosomal protein S16
VRPGAFVRPLSCRGQPARRQKIGSGFSVGSGQQLAANPAKIATKFKEAERNRIAVVMIRLARVGAPKQPFYRIVVIEKDRARNGRSIEVVGTYNPRTSPATVDLKHERIAYWRSKGARLSTIMEKLVTKNPAPVVTEPAETVTDPAAA